MCALYGNQVMRSGIRWLCARLCAAAIVSVSGVVVQSYRVAAQYRACSRCLVIRLFLDRLAKMLIENAEDVCLDQFGWSYDPNIAGHGASVALVRTPLIFGARNWVVYLVFEDDIVVAVLVRTDDTPRLRPNRSPEDRVADARAPWVAELAATNEFFQVLDAYLRVLGCPRVRSEDSDVPSRSEGRQSRPTTHRPIAWPRTRTRARPNGPGQRHSF